EAELLVTQIGMTPMEAILAYTRDNAKIVGLEGRVGTIAAGKLADIIVWEQDPLKDIRVLQQPALLSAVVKDGRLIDRSEAGFRGFESEPPRANVTPQG
ncbi:MAG: amidohydrolase, partial [Ramlibacter sp.]|nr:amidohydrolase [Ramlibacter sp.]